MTKVNYSGESAVIVCHDSVFGPPHELRDYFLRHNIKSLLFIGHVNRYLPNNPVTSSYIELYEKGKLVKKAQAKRINLPEWIGYIRDIILTKWWFLKYMRFSSTYFIGLGNMNLLCGLVGKLFGTVTHAIYYVIDYSPVRFSNKIMNGIFHGLDYVCSQYSSVTWNYAKGMMIAREKKWKKKFPHQTIIPNGITIKKNLPGYSTKNRHELVYIGTLVKQQGVMFVVHSMMRLKKIIPDIHLTIIGMGDLKKEIESYCKMNNITYAVDVAGYIPDPYEADKILSKGALGVAMYAPDNSIVGYTEPGKIKRYLSCSVPVIMTPVSPIANDIEKYHCGFKCPYDTPRFVSMVSAYLHNETEIELYRKNALAYAKRFEWEKVFTKSFQELTNTI